ncbi:MAG: hypothetical protein ACRC7U_06900 [Moraxella sp.]
MALKPTLTPLTSLTPKKSRVTQHGFLANSCNISALNVNTG